MSRPTKTVKLSSGAEVDIITYLTWGEKETIQAVLMSGGKIDNSGLSGFDSNVLKDYKYKGFETCIIEVRESGEKKKFTKEWVNDLSAEDGDMLYDEVEALIPKKKLTPSA